VGEPPGQPRLVSRQSHVWLGGSVEDPWPFQGASPSTLFSAPEGAQGATPFGAPEGVRARSEAEGASASCWAVLSRLCPRSS